MFPVLHSAVASLATAHPLAYLAICFAIGTALAVLIRAR
jgi:hypothetical protein